MPKKNGIKTTLARIDKTLNKVVVKVIEIDEYLREKVATKDELRSTESRLMDHIDGFAERQIKFDQELAALTSRKERIEGAT